MKLEKWPVLEQRNMLTHFAAPSERLRHHKPTLCLTATSMTSWGPIWGVKVVRRYNGIADIRVMTLVVEAARIQ